MNDEGISRIALEPKGEGYCAFEYVYMMSPDSVLANKNIYKTRVRAGKNLWHEHPVELPDEKKLLVMPVPNSGRPAALGFYHEAKKTLGERVEYDERLLVNQYMGRNFIKETKNRAAFLKFFPIPNSFLGEEIEDAVDEYHEYLVNDDFEVIDRSDAATEAEETEYELVLIDDSIVRGDTAPDTLQLTRKIHETFGADTIHMRIVSPEIRFPCDKGVAMPTYQELIANRIPDIKDREDYLGVKSLGHLSVEGLVASIGIDKSRLCTECMDGHGPHSDRKGATIPLEESGVLLDNTSGIDIIKKDEK